MLLSPARQSRPGLSAKGYSAERLVNYFARQSDGISQLPLMGRSGFVSRANVSGPVRAIHGMGGNAYVAAGGALWRVDNLGAVSYIGSIPDDPQTYMAASDTQLAVVAGGQYAVTQGTTLTQYTPGAIETPRGLTYLDGYFLISGEIGGREDYVQASALDDATTFDALDFAAAESQSDRLEAILADHGELWLIGSRSIEVWYNAGTLQFPFAPNPASRVEHGCLNGKTVAKADNAVFWVGENGIVYRSGGGMPSVISTREVEEDLAKSTVIGGFTFTDRGHQFYAVTRQGQTTLVFDITTGMWAERSTGVVDAPWICTCAHRVEGREYFGTTTGKIGFLSDEAYTDDGAVIEAECISIPVEQSGNYFTVSRLHVQIAGGFGVVRRECGETPIVTETDESLVIEDNVTEIVIGGTEECPPRCMLQISKDGRNWGVERWRDLGKLGEYYKRAVWHGIGTGRRLQFRLRITDPVKRDIYGVAYE